MAYSATVRMSTEPFTCEPLMVVLVDDDESFRSALAETLREDGHAVLEFASAVDVPSLHTLPAVDVVITDYDMPGKNGLAFADTIHTEHPHVPVILVTALPTSDLVAQTAVRTYIRLLAKPLNYAELRNVLLGLPGPARTLR